MGRVWVIVLDFGIVRWEGNKRFFKLLYFRVSFLVVWILFCRYEYRVSFSFILVFFRSFLIIKGDWIRIVWFFFFFNEDVKLEGVGEIEDCIILVIWRIVFVFSDCLCRIILDIIITFILDYLFCEVVGIVGGVGIMKFLFVFLWFWSGFFVI